MPRKTKVTYSARCLNKECDWTEDSEKADSRAQRHTNTTGHATLSKMSPLVTDKRHAVTESGRSGK